MQPELSIVIPAYNEERRLGGTLQTIREYVAERQLQVEILIVDDGSLDGTRDVAERNGGPCTRIVVLPENRGKGAAVKKGVLAAKGKRILVTDADLSTPIEDLERLELAVSSGALAFGSRRAESSAVEEPQPLFRRTMGIIFQWVVRLAGVAGVKDSQCGFKMFRRHTALPLFHRMITDGFAWDVELLWLAQRAGIEVREVGVRWRDSRDSRVRPVRDSLRMLGEIARFRMVHVHIGDSPEAEVSGSSTRQPRQPSRPVC